MKYRFVIDMSSLGWGGPTEGTPIAIDDSVAALPGCVLADAHVVVEDKQG